MFVTGRPKVYYFEATAALLFKQDVLRFHITMNNFIAAEGVQALQERVAEFSDQLEAEPLEFVLFDEFVEVDGEQFESDAHVIAEGERVEHVDDVHGVVFVLLAEVF